MAQPLTEEGRRLLEMLAASADGATEALLLAHGFTLDLIARVVIAGLATAKVERMVAGRRTVEVERVRITDAGRVALER
jgi:hypothetical protein